MNKFGKTFIAVIILLTATAFSLFILQKAARSFVPAAQWQDAELPLTPPMAVLPELSERTAVLVMGIDSNGADCDHFKGTRSDVMMLAWFDPQKHKIGLISIPRDSRVAIAGHRGLGKINSAHALGGPELAMATVRESLGVPVDHYVLVDTDGLKKICELLGPMQVFVEKEMRYRDQSAHLDIDLKAGLQTLTPSQVEQYVRFRHDASADLGRMERQQWFLRQAMSKLQDPQVLLRLPEMIKVAYDSVKTDLTADQIASLVDYGRKFEAHDILTATLPGDGEDVDGVNYFVLDAKGCQAIFDRVIGDSAGVVADGSVGSESTLRNCKLAADAPTRPITIALKYAMSSEYRAKALEKELTDAGYRVRYLWQVQPDDCRHDEIIMKSRKAGYEQTAELKGKIQSLSHWPVVLAPMRRAPCDLTVVVRADL